MKITLFGHVSEATLAELADGAITPDRLSPSERQHLDACDRCLGLLEGHRRAGRLLAADWQMVALAEAAAAAGAPTRLVRRVGAGQLLGGSQTRRSAQVAPLVTAIALVAVLGLALWSIGGLPPIAPGASPSHSATPSHPASPTVTPPAQPTASPSTAGFQPEHLAVDAAGRLYVTDCGRGLVLRVDDAGEPVVVAGVGRTGLGFSGDGGPATEAPLECPYQIAFDAAGDLYIADAGHNRVRKVNSAGVISTVAGSGDEPAGWGIGGFSGDGGPATEALLRNPAGIAFDGQGNLYIADMNNNRIRMVDTDGIITTIAGGGVLFPQFGGDGGPALEANLRSPQGIAVDGEGNIYFVDSANNRLRMIDPNGQITTIAGTGELASYGDEGPAVEAALARPRAVLVDGEGNIYVSEAVLDTFGWNRPVPEGVGNRVRVIDVDGIIHAFAGTGEIGFSGDGGLAVGAQLNGVNHNFGLAIDDAGNVYIADSGNRRIRVVSRFGIITTFADGSR